MSVANTTGPAPGWYPDPNDPSALRWWDGTAWTDFTTPLPAAPVAPEPEAVAEPEPESTAFVASVAAEEDTVKWEPAAEAEASSWWGPSDAEPETADAGAWSFDPQPAAEPQVSSVWAPEPVAEPEAPADVSSVWSPEPAVEPETPADVSRVWTPGPVVEPETPAGVSSIWAPQPVVEPEPEPIVEAPVEPSSVWAPEPAVEPEPITWTPDPVVEPETPAASAVWVPDSAALQPVEVAPEPFVAAVAPEPIVEVAPEPVVEVVSEPVVVEAAPEPVVAEVAPEPVVAEVAPEPVVEVAPEPVVEVAPEPVVAVDPEPVVEVQAPVAAPTSFANEAFRAALASARAARTTVEFPAQAPEGAGEVELTVPEAGEVDSASPEPVAEVEAPAAEAEPAAEVEAPVVEAEPVVEVDAPVVEAEAVVDEPVTAEEAVVADEPVTEEAPAVAPATGRRSRLPFALLAVTAVAGGGYAYMQVSGSDDTTPAVTPDVPAKVAAAPAADLSCLKAWNTADSTDAVQLRVTLGQFQGAYASLGRVQPIGGTVMSADSCALRVYDEGQDTHAIFVDGVKGKDGYIDVTGYPRAAKLGWPKSATEANVRIEKDGSVTAIKR